MPSRAPPPVNGLRPAVSHGQRSVDPVRGEGQSAWRVRSAGANCRGGLGVPAIFLFLGRGGAPEVELLCSHVRSERSIAVNRKALHDYSILSSVEAGLALTGTEIKSIREGRVNLRDSYARVEQGEMWLYNAHIAQYAQGNRYNHEPLRRRKLLLHRDEIRELERETAQKGLTLVPLRMYYKRGMAKLQLALVRGRKVV